MNIDRPPEYLNQYLRPTAQRPPQQAVQVHYKHEALGCAWLSFVCERDGLSYCEPVVGANQGSSVMQVQHTIFTPSQIHKNTQRGSTQY